MEKIESNVSKGDRLKWIVAVAILGLAIVGFYFYTEYPVIYRVLGIVGAIVLDIIILFNTEKGKELRNFMHDARVELNKVIWATRTETLQTTLIIFVVVILMAFFLWLLDKLLGSGVKLLLS
tara:strand:- start:3083 stop:3448 length:366 start_codon:yes stop_codon:yes gene_type:complete